MEFVLKVGKMVPGYAKYRYSQPTFDFSREIEADSFNILWQHVQEQLPLLDKEHGVAIVYVIDDKGEHRFITIRPTNNNSYQFTYRCNYRLNMSKQTMVALESISNTEPVYYRVALMKNVMEWESEPLYNIEQAHKVFEEKKAELDKIQEYDSGLYSLELFVFTNNETTKYELSSRLYTSELGRGVKLIHPWFI